MARLFDEAASEFLEMNSSPLGAANIEPFTFACWFYADADSGSLSKELITVSDRSQSNHYHRLRAVSSEAVTARSQGGVHNESATSSTTFSLGEWNHACGVWTSASSRAAFLNGGSKGTNSVFVIVNGLDRTSIGRVGDSTPGAYMSGRIAEAGIWDVALTDDEVVSLAGGVSPLHVRRASLQAYWPLPAFTGDAIDYSGNGNTLTDNNTVGIADHAPVGPMFGFDLGWQGAFTVAVAGGRTMGSLAGLGGLAGHGGIAGRRGGIAA